MQHPPANQRTANTRVSQNSLENAGFHFCRKLQTYNPIAFHQLQFQAKYTRSQSGLQTWFNIYTDQYKYLRIKQKNSLILTQTLLTKITVTEIALCSGLQKPEMTRKVNVNNRVGGCGHCYISPLFPHIILISLQVPCTFIKFTIIFRKQRFRYNNVCLKCTKTNTYLYVIQY